MSTYDPNDSRPRIRSGNAGGGWIAGIIVVVLIALSILWWAGPNVSGQQTATTDHAPASTTGAAPSGETK
ncbi:MAG: hypothetical protein ACTHLO_09535 [Pseudolabrys sp.]